MCVNKLFSVDFGFQKTAASFVIFQKASTVYSKWIKNNADADSELSENQIGGWIF